MTEGLEPDAVGRLPARVTVLLDAHDPDPARRNRADDRLDGRGRDRARGDAIILSGGLNAGQRRGAPWSKSGRTSIDVSSGVESAPGMEGRGKAASAFLRQLRSGVSQFMNPSFGHRDPDARGYYGAYGGRFVPETLVAPVEELERAYFAARQDERSGASSTPLLRDYVGRPTPLYEARRLSESLGGARIFLKREDLAHTGAHKINNALGQALLAQRMGKRRIIAETGAGQHGVATATVCALLGLECDVYMGAEDMERQALNVFRMQLLGATVRRVDAGSRTLKDAINEAMRDWVTNVADTLLPARFGARSASVSADGPRIPVGHRPARRARRCLERSAGCRTRSSRASGAAATRWASSTRSSTIRACG